VASAVDPKKEVGFGQSANDTNIIRAKLELNNQINFTI